MDCQSFRQGCCGCCVNMRGQQVRIAAFLAANTAAAARLLPPDRPPRYRDLVRLHIARGGLIDHLLACWLVPLTFGLSALLWRRLFGSCRFAGFIDSDGERVGCLIHPLRLGGSKDLRRHAFPLVPTLGCNRSLICPMLVQHSMPTDTGWPEASRAGAASLRKRCAKTRRRSAD